MYLIAELGINHNGNLDTVDTMIRQAALCGADAVKFQKRDIETVYTKEFLDSPRESPWGNTQRAQKEGLEFSFEDYRIIDRICKEVNIQWFSSAWDFKSLEMMDSFGPPFHKIASAFNNHSEFIRAVGRTGRPVILSTGMASLTTIEEAVKILRFSNCRKIILMHCVSIYPCPDELCNINTIHSLRKYFPDCTIGYSGHEVGITPTLAAISLGAEYIERHFTLNRADYGSDQAASLEPKGLARIREYGDQIKACMGNGIILPLNQEMECASKLRYWEAEDIITREG